MTNESPEFAGVFLSYASADREKALHVAGVLEAHGIATWIDRKSIVGGTRWSGEIVAGVKTCAVVVVLITPASMRSRNVQQELQLAWEHDRKILPLVLAAAPLPATVEYALAGTQWVEVLDHPEEIWLPHLLRALSGLGVPPTATTTAPSALPAATPSSLAPPPSPSAATNLPAPTTPLVGRESELAQVGTLLGDPAVRLVTLTGPGGVGKTRLALGVAVTFRDRFADGVWFVSLASLTDPALVPSTIAQALGVREAANAPIDLTLREFLHTRNLLLVVDNLEHLVPAAPLLSELLAQSPKLKVLTTSRAPLNLSGEHEIPVPPLALPARGPAVEVARASAVELFVQRARAIKPDFALTDENAVAVVEICRRLDGLPLAIELAAARIRLLPPKALLARLQGNGSGPLALLTSGAKDLAPRQSTLRATIAWSYDLLDPPEQALFRRLGVFAGGFDLEAATGVSSNAGNLDLDPLDGLTSLVAKSLVRQDEAAGEPRFSLLVTLHDFAREALGASGELDAVARAHATYFVAFAEEAAPRLQGPEHATWFDRLERDHDNLRAAFAWLVAKGEVELGLRLAVALGRYWREHGYVTEGREMCAAILAVTPDSVRTIERERVLAGEGMFARIQGDYEGAERALNASLTLAREVHDDAGVASVLNRLGTVAKERGKLPEASASYQESLAIFRQIGDRSGTAAVLNNLGTIAYYQGDYPGARAYYEDAFQSWRAAGSKQLVAMALANLGEVAHRLSEDDRALGLLVEALQISRRYGDGVNLALELEALVGVHASRGDPTRAARLGGAAATLRQSLGNPSNDADRQELESILAKCRQALGDVTYTRAWTEGQGMTLDDAIAEAVTPKSA